MSVKCMCVHCDCNLKLLEVPRACMFSWFCCVRLFATLWTGVCQAPLSMGFSRQEYWSGLQCPPPRDPADPGSGLVSCTSCTAGGLFTADPPKKPSRNGRRNAIYGHHTLLRKTAAISRPSPNLTEFSLIDQLKSSTTEKGILEYMLPRCNRQWWWKNVTRLTSIVCSFVNLVSKTSFFFLILFFIF